MKKVLFFLLAASVTGMTACKKDTGIENNQSITPVKLSVSVSTALINENAVPLEGTKIVITNKANNASYQSIVNAEGMAIFESITPGVYTINASLTITAATYNQISGENVEDDIYLNQSLNNMEILTDQQVNLDLITSRVGDWVFKQIFYAGSNTSNGAAFRDVFVEIYNNSNDTLYADSLYFAQAIGKNNNNAGEYFLSNFQYDWSKSLNMMGANANTEYVYSKGVFMIPSDGTGKKYPVAPGNSIIIAATAINHKEPYVNNDGITQNVVNPQATIDLSNADFDVYMVPYLQAQDPTSNPYKFDINNPLVPKVEVIHAVSQKDLVMDALGRESYVIFKMNTTASALPKYTTPDVRTIIADSKFYVQIPVANVIDGVEIQHPISTTRVPRRLPTTLDAGASFVPGGQYSGQSLVRKTKKTLTNGRKVLQDTNNSENDFGYLTKADPSKGSTSFVN